MGTSILERNKYTFLPMKIEFRHNPLMRVSKMINDPTSEFRFDNSALK